MRQQAYHNHKKYYFPHHFVFYPVLLGLILFSARTAMKDPGQSRIWWAITAIFVLLAWLSFMLRQHYALTVQNRIVRLELRLRYFQLTQKRLEDVEKQLSFKQLAALRFASDEELPELLQKAIDNKLSADQIKRSIRHWLPDNMRV